MTLTSSTSQRGGPLVRWLWAALLHLDLVYVHQIVIRVENACNYIIPSENRDIHKTTYKKVAWLGKQLRKANNSLNREEDIIRELRWLFCILCEPQVVKFVFSCPRDRI